MKYTSGDDEGGRAAAIVVGFEGNDDLSTYSEGSCVLGGVGDDVLRSDYEPVNETAGRDILVGGPGDDRFVIGASGPIYPLIVDLEESDIIQISGLTLSLRGFFQKIPSFEGNGDEVESDAIRVVYDPDDGTLWKYEEGAASSELWVPAFQIVNFGDIEPVESQIITGGFLD